jgi:RNA polymerase sigma-70 factor (ECF subfamily)
MLRVAACYVRGPAAAEDVVQETWLAVLAGLAGFEGRSSLRTWTFSILVNRARTYAVREWSVQPEDAALAGEVRDEISAALAGLPQRQRTVVTLRDVLGLSSDEACEVLGIAAPNQRVLLHRARARLRSALEDYCQPARGSG